MSFGFSFLLLFGYEFLCTLNSKGEILQKLESIVQTLFESLSPVLIDIFRHYYS